MEKTTQEKQGKGGKQKRHKEKRACALEKQRMEEKSLAQVEERKQRAAEEIKPNALDAETTWRNQIDELYAHEVAVPQTAT